ncbi:hypothetical protein [Rhodoblastus sp.]|uniref:hypothetical protein n=1 Tax=Rhodoblastus sp. TaxID=1962975 RepID=UPI003F9BA008
MEATAAAAAAMEAAASAPHQFQLRRRGGGAYVGSRDRKGQGRIEVCESQRERESIRSEPIHEHFEPPRFASSEQLNRVAICFSRLNFI